MGLSMTEVSKESVTFSGNSKRAWISSVTIMIFAILLFTLDLASNGWKFELGLNIIEIIIVFLVITRWRTRIRIDNESIHIQQLNMTKVPLAGITRLSIIYTPLMGYVAAIDWKHEGQRRPKRNSFFASFYKEEQVNLFLKTLRNAMPEGAEVELAQKYKREQKKHGTS